VLDLPAEDGFSVPEAAAARPAGSPARACGLSKRYLLNQVADEGGYDALVMGHNLDDEAATLLRKRHPVEPDYLARQRPVLPASDGGLARKVKPLVRVAERETAAYAVLRGIDYEVEECPMAAGNTINRYKEWLNRLEDSRPASRPTSCSGSSTAASAAFEIEPPELRRLRPVRQSHHRRGVRLLPPSHQTLVRIGRRSDAS
jgi:tRNA-5-methyluridine54 2-sulfurtransferase